MNLEQAKAKLDSVSKSTATKHPKVLVSELCGIVRFLLDEIGRIQSPKMTVLTQQPQEEVKVDPPRPIRTSPKIQPPWPNRDKERKTKKPDIKKLQIDKNEGGLNAGDAE